MVAINRFLELAWRDKLRAVEACLFVGLARMAVLTVPFRLLARTLGQASGGQTAPADAKPATPSTVALGVLIERVSRHTPWKSNCLAKAIAAKFMLRRRGIGTTLFFGLARDDQGQLQAHAWTSCGGSILTGRAGADRYTVVAGFDDVAK